MTKQVKNKIKEVLKKHLKTWLYYLLAIVSLFLLWSLFEYVPLSYIPMLNLLSLGASFFISVYHLKRYKNPFIPLILLLYCMATVIEIQSTYNLTSFGYRYTNLSYRLWAVGNWMVIIAVFFELRKIVVEIETDQNGK